ncbi:hypothetical protein WF331_21280 [Pseudomonas sp. YNh]
MKSDFMWLVSLCKKICIASPVRSLSATLLLLLANASAILAFFLPVKTLIIAGASTLPHYFNAILPGATKNQVVLALCLASALFLLIHHTANYFANRIMESGARNLIRAANKIQLFEDQDTFAKLVYNKTCNLLASVAFIAIGFIVGGNLTPLSFLLLLAISAALLLFIFSNSAQRTPQKTNAAIPIYNGLSYLIVFATLIYSHLEQPGDILTPLASLIIARQVIQRTASLCSDILYACSHKAKINSLFFISHQFKPVISETQSIFWSLLERNSREPLFRETLGLDKNISLQLVESSYTQTGTPNIIAFALCVVDKKTHQSELYTSKFYGPGKNTVYQHESLLFMSEWASALPCPTLLVTRKVNDYFFSIFNGDMARKPEPVKLKSTWYQTLAKCWKVEPCEETIEKYKRSKPFFTKNLNKELLDQAKTVCCDSDQAVIEEFENRLSSIIEDISSSPLVIINPDLSMATIYLDSLGNPFCSNWTRWGVEYLGAGWPTAPQDLKAIEDHIDEQTISKYESRSECISKIRTTAIAYALEQQLTRQNYNIAIELMKQI